MDDDYTDAKQDLTPAATPLAAKAVDMDDDYTDVKQ